MFAFEKLDVWKMAKELGFIKESHSQDLAPDIENLANKLSALRNSQLSRKSR